MQFPYNPYYKFNFNFNSLFHFTQVATKFYCFHAIYQRYLRFHVSYLCEVEVPPLVVSVGGEERVVVDGHLVVVVEVVLLLVVPVPKAAAAPEVGVVVVHVQKEQQKLWEQQNIQRSATELNKLSKSIIFVDRLLSAKQSLTLGL